MLWLPQHGAVPPVPRRSTPYLTALSSTDTVAPGGAYTFQDVDLGEPHPNRVIVPHIHMGINTGTFPEATINGVVGAFQGGGLGTGTATRSTRRVVHVPNGRYGTVIIHKDSSDSGDATRCVVHLFVVYPPAPASQWTRNTAAAQNGLWHVQTDSASSTTDAVITTTVPFYRGDLVLWWAFQPATNGGDLTITWSGSDTVVTSVEANYASATRQESGYIEITENVVAAGATLTCAETTSGQKAITIAVFRPAMTNPKAILF